MYVRSYCRCTSWAESYRLGCLAFMFWLSGGCASPEQPEVPVLFEDVSETAGLGAFRHETGASGQKWMPETYGSGAGFVDLDRDDWVDILLVNGRPLSGNNYLPPLVVYRNNQDGTFSDVTESIGIHNATGYGFGLAAADFDNDGDNDVFISTLGRNLFFQNDDGRLIERAQEVGLGDTEEWSTAAVFFDADRDGWADLYVGNYVPWTPETDLFCTSDGTTKDYCMPHQYEGQPGRFYQNTGMGTFVERTTEAGFGESSGKTLGAVSFDYNRDGWPDLVVANDTRRNLLYKNRGDGAFDEVGIASGIAYDRNGKARAGMGVSVGSLDDSGEPAVVIGNFSDEMAGVFRHMGHGVFVDRGAASGVGMPSLPTLTFGLLLFDVELDGDLDVLLANGHILEQVEKLQDGVTYRQRPQLFLNDGAGKFSEVDPSLSGVLSESLVARGAAYADYDRDGDLDVLIVENGGSAHLWRNTTDPYESDDVQSVTLRLTNSVGNSNALGASVSLIVEGLPVQQRFISTGGSYLSQSELSPIFGIGNHSGIDTLRIAWPSGQIEEHYNVKADRELYISECRTPSAECRLVSDN